ncbi:MAG: ATP-dependent RecD-like DNA helicase [Verrucomicrobia bacterium]|nr:ATP-dependent RecD-like DNA helicase [Verrucomicrobiota bacterium]
MRSDPPFHSSPDQPLEGTVERVTFHNEENGFAVLRVQVKGRRDLVPVVGHIAAVHAGEWLQAKGQWINDRQHGTQFQATSLRCCPPTSSEGLTRYLASGLVKGIGPVYARKLVARFGPQLLDIIEHSSARLEEIDGIGPERRRRIKKAWNDQMAVRAIMLFLYSHGVSTSRAIRIHRTYGDQAIDRVRAQPYALADDIPGIGFKTADQIAARLGVAKDSATRIAAGLTHVLLQATQAGHCALPRPELEQQAQALLDVPAPSIQSALDELLSRRRLILDPIPPDGLVFHPALLRSEQIVAACVRQLANQSANYPIRDVDSAIRNAESHTGAALAPSQRDALRQALSQRLLILTGGPGVGKTTIVQTLLAILDPLQVRCQLCAPTGRAAQRLTETTGHEAKTIHRLLEYRPGQNMFHRNADRPLDLDLLVVDEMSMVDLPLAHRLLQALPPSSRLLLVGDADQLPSVGPGNVLRDLIASGRIPVARLTEVFRQAAQSRIITAAHEINHGRSPRWPRKGESADCFFIERDTAEDIVRTIRDLVHHRIPNRFHLDPVRDIQVLTPMNRGALGMRELNLALQADLNPPASNEMPVQRFGWSFQLRDKVIQTENDYDKEVFNGDIGRITDIDADSQELRVQFDSRSVVYDFGELDELSLAYALTIHKAQGSEFPAVVLTLATAHYLLLRRNLLYTAVTRGRQLVVIVGQPRALSIAIRNAHAEARHSGLLHRLQSAESILSAPSPFEESTDTEEGPAPGPELDTSA